MSKLAFELMRAETPTDFRLEIGEVDAQNLLGSKKALDHLVRNHLLQTQGKPGNRRIRFCHQSLQEYYAAEAMLVMLEDNHPDVMDDQRLQYFYLNYLKWTEPLAMMLSLLEYETQVVRVVQVALDVDLMLGARLAGEVQPQLQRQSVNLVMKRPVPQLVQIQLMGKTRSDTVIPKLLLLLRDGDFDTRYAVSHAFGEIGSSAAVAVLEPSFTR